MKFVKDLRGVHENKEIWIAGSGPSLDDYPDDFFKDKILITLSWAFIAFPKCTYWHVSHPEKMLQMKKRYPKILKKSFILLPLVPFKGESPKQMTDERSLELFGEDKDDPVYLRWHRILGNRAQFMKLLPQTIDAIIAGQDCKYIALSTLAHYAIQIAVILGAKKVSLVGCEGKASEDRLHAKNRGLLEIYPKMSPQQFQRYLRGCDHFRFGTKILAEAFKPYGIEVRRYFYGKGYEKIGE